MGVHRGRVYRLEDWWACQQLELVSQLSTVATPGWQHMGRFDGPWQRPWLCCGAASEGCMRPRLRWQAHHRRGVRAAACVEAAAHSSIDRECAVAEAWDGRAVDANAAAVGL
jgi:hypothetical protein